MLLVGRKPTRAKQSPAQKPQPDRLTVSFGLSMRAHLKALAEQVDRSEGWLVREAVKRLLDDHRNNRVQLELDLLKGDDLG